MSTLTRGARETIKWHWSDDESGARTTIAGYTRHNFGDQGWGGDRCGCVDDRCIGFHHDEHEECHCLPVWLDDYVASELAPTWFVLDVSGASTRTSWLTLDAGEHREIGQWFSWVDAEVAELSWRAQGWTVSIVEKVRDTCGVIGVQA